MTSIEKITLASKSQVRRIKRKSWYVSHVAFHNIYIYIYIARNMLQKNPTRRMSLSKTWHSTTALRLQSRRFDALCSLSCWPKNFPFIEHRHASKFKLFSKVVWYESPLVTSHNNLVYRITSGYQTPYHRGSSDAINGCPCLARQ
jgi:hypothetical protein